MSAKTACKVCNEISRHKCGNCHNAFYCSKDHQKLDWINHKPNCLSYKIAKNDMLGRHLVSTRIIVEGEVIIKEPPLVEGPSQVTPSVCLGCYDLLTEFNVKECSLCGLPVCSKDCENSSSHLPECQIIRKNKKSKVKINLLQSNFWHPSYRCFTILRCLYLKKSQPDLWKKLMNLESNHHEKESIMTCKSDELLLENFITHFFNYLDSSKDEIIKIMGIIQINAHEIPLKEPKYIAVYEKASLLEHNCRANCTKSFTNSGEIVIRAAEKILPGDHLSICYTDPLWGREMRMNHLLQTKFFLCQCIRCTDPTEMGTHFNSFRCLKRHCSGFAIPMSNSSSTNDDFHVKCQTCNKVLSKEFLIKEVHDCFAKLDKKNEKACTEFLQKYEKILHPNHHIMVSVKLSLIELYSWKEKLIFLDDNIVEWVIKTCENLHCLAATLVPAENRLRGVLMYQFYLALSESGRRNAANLQSVKSVINTENNLQECKKSLMEACKLLEHEPSELPEGKIAIKIKKILQSLQNPIESE